MTQPCYAHPNAKATATCKACKRGLCATCVSPDASVQRCEDCAHLRDRVVSIIRFCLELMVLALVVAAVSTSRPPKPPKLECAPPPFTFDYGEDAAEVKRLEAQLEREPCDRDKIRKLVEIMADAGDNRGVLIHASAFFEKCGDFSELRWVTYRAHKALSEWDLAIGEATKLVESSPFDPDFRAWRGYAYEQRGDYMLAAEDYRQALLLNPKLQDLPLKLAAVYERQGKPCDAIFPLQQIIFYHPELWEAGSLRAHIDDLMAKGACAQMVSGSRVRIRYHAGESQIRVEAQVNDQSRGTFAIDSGASYVSITRRFAEGLGVDITHAPRVLIQTANGARHAALVILNKVEVGSVRAVQVPAVVLDDLGGLSGLLGLSFLSRFDVHQANGVLEIAAPAHR